VVTYYRQIEAHAFFVSGMKILTNHIGYETTGPKHAVVLGHKGETVATFKILKNETGWNQLEKDWHRFMKIQPDGCFVALKGDKIVGSVTTTPYRKDIGWIGMLIVKEEYQSLGIGSQLLDKAIIYLKELGIETIMLDATEQGKKLYERRGFKVASKIIRYILQDLNLIEISPPKFFMSPVIIFARVVLPTPDGPNKA